MEPNDEQLASAMHKAEVAEHKATEQRKHKFRGGSGSSRGSSGGSGASAAKRQKLNASGRGGSSGRDRQPGGGGPQKPDPEAKGTPKAALLSFGDDDDE